MNGAGLGLESRVTRLNMLKPKISLDFLPDRPGCLRHSPGHLRREFLPKTKIPAFDAIDHQEGWQLPQNPAQGPGLGQPPGMAGSGREEGRRQGFLMDRETVDLS